MNRYIDMSTQHDMPPGMNRYNDMPPGMNRYIDMYAGGPMTYPCAGRQHGFHIWDYLLIGTFGDARRGTA